MTASRDERPLKVRLKTKKNRTVSQKRWLERQLNDPYVARAKREGLRSRAAYKLIEIDDKASACSKPVRAWSILAPRPAAGARSRPNASARRDGPSVVAIDLLDMAPIAGVDFLQLDFLDPEAPGTAQGHARRSAPTWCSPTWRRTRPATRSTDHLKIMALVEAAAEFAREVLRPGGTFLSKVLQGGTEATLLADLKRDFASVKHVKPQASRADSAELYLLATGFRHPTR